MNNESVVVRQYGSVISCCPCPCNTIFFARGKCFDCGHIRYFQSQEVIESDPRIEASPALKTPYIKGLTIKEQALLRVMGEKTR